MENKQPAAAESEGSSICSDLEQMNLADFALDKIEAKSNDENVGEIEKIKAELVEVKKEMEAMKSASKADSNEIANKFNEKIDHLEKYVNDQLQKLAQENLTKMFLMEKKNFVNPWMMDESTEEKLAKMEEAMAKLKEEIHRKDRKLAEKDEEIFTLGAEIYHNSLRWEAKETEIYKLLDENANLKEKMDGKEAKIGALENEIDGLKAEIGQKDQKLAEQEAKIGSVEEEIDQKNEELAEKDAEIRILEEEIDQKNEELAEKDAEICTLEEEISQKDEKLAEKDAEIRILEEEIDQKNEEFAEKDAEICTLEEEISQKDEKLAEQQEAKIRTLENEIAELKQQKKKVVYQQSNNIGWKKNKDVVKWIISSTAKPTKTSISTEDANKTEPKKAYSNSYGYCAGCEQGFLQTDWVRQVGDLQYHVDCFKCVHCRRQLLTGEGFGQDSKIQRHNRALGKMVPRILCKKDYMELVILKKSTQVVNASNVSDAGSKWGWQKAN